MANSYKSLMAQAWRKAGVGSRELPGEVLPQISQQEFDQLKAEYVAQHGYTIRIPQFDDVVHLKPDFMKTEQELKAEKKANLIRLLESPSPQWAQKYSSVMTAIDNIQDTASVLIPLANLAWRAAPKVFGKLLPIIGWASLGYDLLNLANAVGRIPMTPMKSKRAVCKIIKSSPFSKRAQWERLQNIKNWKPNMADFLQAAQVSDDFLGIGLSLGAIMGAIQSLPFAAYRYLSGDKVNIDFGQPDISNLQRLGGNAMKTAALISSHGQIFSEDIHLYAYVTAALGAMAASGDFRESDLATRVEDPMNILLPAERPTNPTTISVIEEMGLNVEQGIGWPYNGLKEISAGDLLDASHEPIRNNFIDYTFRHTHDWYGWLAAWSMDYVTTHTIPAIDPQAGLKQDDTPEMKVFWKMIKAPLLPTEPVTQEKGDTFIKWVNDYTIEYGKEPGILEIEQKLNSLGITTKTTYPNEPEPGAADLWPDGYSGDDF